MGLSRRRLLEEGVLLGTVALLGCDDGDATFGASSSSSSATTGAGGAGGMGAGGTGGSGGGGPSCPSTVEGGALQGQANWAEPITVSFDAKVGSGLGARLFTDLTTLEADDLVTPNERFYIRTEYPSVTLDPNDPYEIQLDGLVDQNVTVPIEDLLPLVEPHGLQLLECSGNFIDANIGLMSVADWAGVPIQKVFDMVSIQPQATRVLIRGYDHLVGNTPGASWVFTFDQLLEAGAILATEMNGVPLPPDHGAPVRLLIPNWFGCCNIKWVNQISFVDDSEPATEHMQEYASRTLQLGVPALARDYLAATIDQTACPVAVEKWLLDGQIVYRLRGVMWGGYKLTDSLAIQIDQGELTPVTVCPAHTSNKIWAVWEHLWVPPATGTYLVRCWFTDSDIPQRRLESGRYARNVVIDQV